MNPMLCTRCHKNIAVVFVTRFENGESKNEGLCLKCAKELGIKPVEDMMQKMGISDDDLDNLSGEMMSALQSAASGMEGLIPQDADQDASDDNPAEEDEGRTATFPFLNKLMGSMPPLGGGPTPNPNWEAGAQAQREATAQNGRKKRKFLDTYCISLTDRAAEGKLDKIVGREQELQRVVQILNRRQKNNPCLIGEPGVGKTAIAEGLALKIQNGDVPYKLRDKEVHLLDLTSLVAGTQFRGQFESRMKGLIEEVKRLERRQHPEARPLPRRDTGHRRHHPHRIPQAHRKGHRAGAPVPARHCGGAVHRPVR